ncbi:hypothetical protein KSP39_PZI023939 [Platanthera zijinensis]|uniref:25S rRNA (uridine-N(3))-methyltransferase BMT5-like domain-containing protein n=1 Tax=Platanthera zijinensis TaxID=2320716 RepID=A0AAP0ATM5_9ASPA
MAKRNLDALKMMGAQIFHDVDAITMDHHTVLRFFRFDRIIFNFPHAGFMGKEDQTNVINLHRQLVLGFFRAAANMIKPHGEIHVSHKTGEPYDKWELEELAAKCSLRLIECSQFRSSDYPGYANKRGAGKSPDLAFHLGSCCTFKFKFYDARQELDRLRKSLVPGMEFNGERIPTDITEQFFGIPRDYRTFMERSYARIGGFGNPLLFSNSPSMARMRDDGQFFAIPRDYCSLIEPSYARRGVCENPLLLNSPTMVGMRDHCFCKTAKYSNAEIILHEDRFFAIRRTSCASLWMEQSGMQGGGRGIPLCSGSNMSSFARSSPRYNGRAN